MISSKLLITFLVFVLVFHAIATINFWYWQYFWLDIPMHFLGGFWAAMFFIWLSSKYFPNLWRGGEKLFFLISVLSFVALIGVFWEFYEFINDVFFSPKGYLGIAQLGAADTIKDLFFDLFGGLAFLLIYRLVKKKNTI